MENKINIAEILKDCPKGTKLYSPIFGDVYLDKIRPHLAIVVTTDKEQDDSKEEFLYDGRYGMNGECMLFPSKENHDWNTFKVQFKEGDIIISKYNSIHILKSSDTSYIRLGSYLDTTQTNCVEPIRFASSEEKEKLFKAIKDNGYKWNPETKTLEKLIVPKFKVGDRIKLNNSRLIYTITDLLKDRYRVTTCSYDLYEIEFKRQDAYKLVPDKFDITTLKPFDKVLVRLDNANKWYASWFSHIDKTPKSYCYPYVTVSGKSYTQIIPYEGNEHLLGTTNDCDEYFKTWE